ncbi:hypothetical protein F5Y14DRAFT_433743 [Nemania sp. NC0429]|nr:hypothetical protein F5Y14DRAFT_433743 [Nemania sp. NC0429]
MAMLCPLTCLGGANVMPFGDTLRDIQAHLQADHVGLPEDTLRPSVYAEQNTETLEQSHTEDSRGAVFDPFQSPDQPYSSGHGTVHTRDSQTTPEPGRLQHIGSFEREYLRARVEEQFQILEVQGRGGKAWTGRRQSGEEELKIVKEQGREAKEQGKDEKVDEVFSALVSFLQSNRRPSRMVPSLTHHTITIEPTPELQLFYNTSRREMDRQRAKLHFEEEDDISWGTKSEGHPSWSPVSSQSGNNRISPYPEPAAEVIRSRLRGGTMKYQLDMEARMKAAFKIKFKLTCPLHRAKRSSCNCHDFSKLEEGYRSSFTAGVDPTVFQTSSPLRLLGIEASNAAGEGSSPKFSSSAALGQSSETGLKNNPFTGYYGLYPRVATETLLDAYHGEKPSMD